MDKVSTIVLASSLVIIMLGMGLSLVKDDFKRIFLYPKAIFIGLINQLILLPLIGFGIVMVFPMAPEIAIGIMILAACPGGPTSNLITHLAKGDTALYRALFAAVEDLGRQPATCRRYIVLFTDGQYVETLPAGRYAFWKGVNKISLLRVDMRETMVDVGGQEMMTADKVTLRMNALVTYRVVDARQSVSVADDARQALYREALEQDPR